MHDVPMSALPPVPMRRRSAAEMAARAAEWEGITAAIIKQRDARARYEAARKAKETPESRARKAALALARKVRRLVVDLDEAQRYAEALRMLEAMPIITDDVQRGVDRLREQLADNLGKVRALAAGGCEVSKALLLQIEG